MSINHINLRRLDLNLLLAFDALMRTRSVSGAGQLLSLGQPAMSHNLRRLRDLFADELLVREAGQLRPTDRGLSLWTPVREALEGLETGLDMVRSFDPETTAQVFRISVPDYLAARILSHLAARVVNATAVQFRIESLDRDLGRKALINGELDAYIGVMPPSDLLDEEPLFADDFATLYDPNQWSLAPDTLGAFCDAAHILVAQAASFEGWVDVALAEAGRSRRVVASVARFGDAVATLRGTKMLATLPRGAVATALAKGLAICEPAVGQQRFEVCLYRRRRAVGAPASEWLCDQVRQCLVSG
ncbi:MAG: LysR substrate-binding domain-containing protein [Pseudomonadota bacterium]